jgi:uncharacterized membrane protein HdeD (DUF308 family)
MSTTAITMLQGAVAMASLVAALFFVRFWRQTKDPFFLLFGIAFGLDAVTRVVIGISATSDETEPFIYIARLVSFALIIVAILQKNRPTKRG